MIRRRSTPAWRILGTVLLCALAACSSGAKKAADGVAPTPSNKPGGAIDGAFAIGGTAVSGANSNDTVNALLGTKTDATIAIGSSLIGDKAALLLMRVRGDGTLDPSLAAAGAP